jgi:hypothetical protein
MKRQPTGDYGGLRAPRARQSGQAAVAADLVAGDRPAPTPSTVPAKLSWVTALPITPPPTAPATVPVLAWRSRQVASVRLTPGGRGAMQGQREPAS